jgi:hypothetical protein
MNVGSNRLPHLAAVANDAHERAAQSLRTATECAREAGDALIEAKAAVGHGGWSAWLKENFKAGERTAQRYMRVAKHWSEITAKTTCVSDLSVNEALRLLESRSDLERAHLMQAERESLLNELAVLAAYVKAPDSDIEGLVHVQRRCNEIAIRAYEMRMEAECEIGRLMQELAA